MYISHIYYTERVLSVVGSEVAPHDSLYSCDPKHLRQPPTMRGSDDCKVNAERTETAGGHLRLKRLLRGLLPSFRRWLFSLLGLLSVAGLVSREELPVRGARQVCMEEMTGREWGDAHLPEDREDANRGSVSAPYRTIRLRTISQNLSQTRGSFDQISPNA